MRTLFEPGDRVRLMRDVPDYSGESAVDVTAGQVGVLVEAEDLIAGLYYFVDLGEISVLVPEGYLEPA